MEAHVGPKSALRPGERRRVQLGAISVMVVALGDEVCAIDEACPHHGASMFDGRQIGECIECPWHHWQIELRTGEVLGWSRGLPPRFVVDERDGELWVRDTRA